MINREIIHTKVWNLDCQANRHQEGMTLWFWEQEAAWCVLVLCPLLWASFSVSLSHSHSHTHTLSLIAFCLVVLYKGSWLLIFSYEYQHPYIKTFFYSLGFYWYFSLFITILGMAENSSNEFFNCFLWKYLVMLKLPGIWYFTHAER